MTDIKALAESRAAAALRLERLGVMNTPTKIEDRIASDAQYKLALDAFDKADRDYRSAIASLSAEELKVLAG